MTWSFDISKAPRGKYVVVNRKFGSTPADAKVFRPDRVILASKCGIVTRSRYIPESKRWEGFAHGEQPVSWMPNVAGALPDHPSVEVSAA